MNHVELCISCPLCAVHVYPLCRCIAKLRVLRAKTEIQNRRQHGGKLSLQQVRGNLVSVPIFIKYACLHPWHVACSCVVRHTDGVIDGGVHPSAQGHKDFLITCALLSLCVYMCVRLSLSLSLSLCVCVCNARCSICSI